MAQNITPYMRARQQHIFANRPEPEKERRAIPKISEKRRAKEAEAAKDDALQKWFLARRKELTGVCQCGCAEKSQKKDDLYFRCSICHIFPKRIFKSVATHPLNYVERSFWNGCHANMDNRSMDLWIGFADFDDIKQKFLVMAPLLTEQERATKFYAKLRELVEKN